MRKNKSEFDLNNLYKKYVENTDNILSVRNNKPMKVTTFRQVAVVKKAKLNA